MTFNYKNDKIFRFFTIIMIDPKLKLKFLQKIQKRQLHNFFNLKHEEEIIIADKNLEIDIKNE